MNEDIIRMAREAGTSIYHADENEIERFAKLVAAAEREACAVHLDKQNTAITDILAAEIRARSQQ